jgi:hypothetical protein
MEEVIAALLVADAGVAAIAGTRIYWSEKPQGSAWPAVVLHKITGLRDYEMDQPTGLVQARVQADCWAKTYGDAVRLSRAVNTALGGYSGGIIQGAFIETERQSFEKSADGAEKFHRVSLDFQIWHTE